MHKLTQIIRKIRLNMFPKQLIKDLVGYNNKIIEYYVQYNKE